MSFVSSPHPPPPPQRPPRGEDTDDISDHLEMHCARRKSHHERRRGTLEVLAFAIPCVYTKRQKKEKPISSHLDRTTLVKDLFYCQKENFSCGAIAGNPARAYLTRLSYQSEGSLRAGSPFGRYRKK